MRSRLTVETPLGSLTVVADETAVEELRLPGETPEETVPERRTPLLCRVEKELQEYFRGTRQDFDLPLAPAGTPFQQRVWQELCRIPYGRTASYGEIAKRIGLPKGSRAVGQANHRNPIPILIPCHRVIAAHGALGGYGGGPDIKIRLLKLEGTPMEVLPGTQTIKIHS
jgi:methylated-DNA-[protein]-cysteine S-methyltransferase